MNGSVYKRCTCAEAPGAKRQTKTCKKDHGSWYFEHDLPTFEPEGKRPRAKRGGFCTKVAAEKALAESMASCIQRGLAAERDARGRRQLLGDYLREWLEGELHLKPSTRRSYAAHIDRYLIPHLGHLRLEEIGTAHLEAMYAKMREFQPRKTVSGSAARKCSRVVARATAARTCRDGRDRLGREQLRSAVLEHLQNHPDETFTPHGMARALRRSSGGTRRALATLLALGMACQVGERPARFVAAPGGGDHADTLPETAVAPSMWRMSPASIQRVHATLRTALNGAVRRRIIDINPAGLVRLEPVRSPRAKYWDSATSGRFLDAIVEDRLYALYHLAVYRGPRRGEIIALRWDDLDLDEGLCEIRRNIVQLGYATVEGTPKSEAGERILALDEDTVAVLRAHQRRQAQERLAAGPAYVDNGLVFAREDGRPLHPESVSRHLDVLIKVAGVPRITFHQLRHTAASLMLEAGAELKYVQYALGHASPIITGKLYTHIARRLDQKRSAQVARMIPRQRLLADGEAQAA